MNIKLNGARAAIVLILFACLVNVTQAQEAETPTLAWNLKAGDELTVEFQQTQNVLTRIDARDRTLESELTFSVDWKVNGVAENGVATIEQTIQRIRIRTGAPGSEVKKVVDIDTGGESQPRGVSRDLLKSAKKLIGLTFEVEMAANGNVTSITPGANVAAATDSLPETSALRGLFTPANLKRLVDETSFALPAKKLKAGDSWGDDSKISLTTADGRELPFERAINSKVTSLEKAQAKIDSEIKLSQGAVPASSQDATALTSPLELLSFTSSGKMVFDRSAGIVTASEVTSSMKTRAIYRTDQITTTIDSINRMTVSRKK